MKEKISKEEKQQIAAISRKWLKEHRRGLLPTAVSWGIIFLIMLLVHESSPELIKVIAFIVIAILGVTSLLLFRKFQRRWDKAVDEEYQRRKILFGQGQVK